MPDPERPVRPSAPRSRLATALLALAALAGPGCISSRSDRGLEPTWRELEPGGLERGRTTRAEVLERLGPPSQILSLGGGRTAFYYLRESNQGSGLVLLVYNRREERTRYDRAVFFFDEQDLLSEYALSAPEE